MVRMKTYNPWTGYDAVYEASGANSTRGPGCQASPLDYITRLPNDLLAKILHPLACDLDTHAAEGVWEAHSAYKQQANLYRMRLVCRKFNMLFSTHVFLVRNMVLKPNTPSQSDVSLLAWARGHTSFVRTLVSCSCPCLELACQGLSSPPSSLSTVECYDCSASALSLLSSFAQLVTCKLHFKADSIIDLSALQAVSSLQLLELGGGVLTASALPLHLQELMLYDADLATSKACCCVTSLQKLTLENSILQFHSNGLSACCALKEFECQHSSISAQDMELAIRSIDHQVIQVPTGLSALSCLTGLSVGPYAGYVRPSFLDCYFCLTNLRSLDLVFTYGQYSLFRVDSIAAATLSRLAGSCAEDPQPFWLAAWSRGALVSHAKSAGCSH